MTAEIRLTEVALADLPIFPLPKTVLLPSTFLSLHVFEPRYRAMMEDCIENHRLMAIAMLDEDGEPDAYDRPRIHAIAGVGALRRSAKLPDGRYNLMIEGLGRVDVSDEHLPTKPYRRARARLIEDRVLDAVKASNSAASVRALSAQALSKLEAADADVIEGIGEIEEPGRLADLVAAVALEEAIERQRILEEPDVLVRLDMVAGILGALLIEDGEEPARDRWGISPGKA